MEKNIAAFVRDNTKTIGVHFFISSDKINSASILGPTIRGEQKYLTAKQYTYVCDNEIEVGDLVVVWAAGMLEVAFVGRVDDDLDIEPNSSTEYSWVVCKVDYGTYVTKMEENKEITDVVKQSYRKSAKQSVKQMLLGSIDSEASTKLTALISPK